MSEELILCIPLFIVYILWYIYGIEFSSVLLSAFVSLFQRRYLPILTVLHEFYLLNVQYLIWKI